MFSEASLPAGFPAPGPVGEVIVKTYPAHRMARAAAGKGANGMFMKLFRHIERNEIAMTAPVVMGWPAENAAEGGGDAAGKQPATQGPESMAFLYGKPTLGAAGVDPADPVVLVEDVTETVVVSVGLRGSYDEATMNRGLERLLLRRDGGSDEPDGLDGAPAATRPGSDDDDLAALEECRLAVEQLVLPQGRPVELLPRSERVRQMQAELAARYRLSSAVFGSGQQQRLRIFPP